MASLYGHDALISLLEQTSVSREERLRQAQDDQQQQVSASQSTINQEHGPTQGGRRPSAAPRRPSVQTSTAPSQPQTQKPNLLRKPSSKANLSTEYQRSSSFPSSRPGPQPPSRTPSFGAQSSLSTPLQKPPMSPPPDPISKNLFGDPDYLSYLDQLTATSLESLKLEPAKLRREASQLQTQLADLAFREYRTFLHANDCTRAMHETFDGLLTRLDALTAQIPDLASSCQSFAASSAIDVLKQRRREHLLLNQHSKMVELLEIPQLMDTLIRNGYYEEAMDLHAHVRRLLLRYPRIELLKSVADELEAATKLMLTQLVNLFTGDVKLPVCIRVIGYLRRMEAVPEPELRLIFLQQRDKYFKRRLEETCGKTPSPNALSKDHVDHLKKYIDVWTNRECFFDIVAQYRGIFSDSQSTTNPSSSALPKSASTFVYDSETHQSLTQSILSSYVTFRVQHLCAMLQAHLPYITDATQIASLCSQVMYFGQSLGWVGIDFRVVVSSLFEDAIEGIVRKTTSQGVREFVGWIREQTVLPMGSDLGSTIKNPGSSFLKGMYVKHSALGGGTQDWSTTFSAGSANSQLRVIPAPTGLLAHPPLAHLLNAYFTAYNHLRALPALTLRARSTSFFHGQLRACAEALDSAMSSEWDNWNSDQKETGRIIVKAWCQGLVPAIVDGGERVWGKDVTTGPDRDSVIGEFTASMAKYLQVAEEAPVPAVPSTENNLGGEVPPIDEGQDLENEPATSSTNKLSDQLLESLDAKTEPRSTEDEVPFTLADVDGERLPAAERADTDTAELGQEKDTPPTPTPVVVASQSETAADTHTNHATTSLTNPVTNNTEET